MEIEGNEAVTSDIIVFDYLLLDLGLGINECCLE